MKSQSTKTSQEVFGQNAVILSHSYHGKSPLSNGIWGCCPGPPIFGHNTGCFSRRWLLLGTKKSAPKNQKTIFFQNRFYSLKAHAHYFTVLIYLVTWRAAKLCIFTNFISINLPRCSQSINSLKYIYYTAP